MSGHAPPQWRLLGVALVAALALLGCGREPNALNSLPLQLADGGGSLIRGDESTTVIVVPYTGVSLDDAVARTRSGGRHLLEALAAEGRTVFYDERRQWAGKWRSTVIELRTENPVMHSIEYLLVAGGTVWSIATVRNGARLDAGEVRDLVWHWRPPG